MSENKPFIYQENTIEFVTVAAQTCLFLEHSAEHEKAEFIEKIICLLSLLYLKTRMLKAPEQLPEEEPQHFVLEEDYNYILVGVRQLLDSDDAYLSVMMDGTRYSDDIITSYISENLADVYQEIKDMAANFQTGNEAIMNDALLQCLIAFKEHWGEKLLSALKALHVVADTLNDEE